MDLYKIFYNCIYGYSIFGLKKIDNFKLIGIFNFFYVNKYFFIYF